MVLVIGSYSNSINPGIYLYQFKKDKGDFELLSEINGIENPSYLAISEIKALIYAISEDKEGDKGRLHIYQLKPSCTEAVLVDIVNFKAAGSCHICTDLNQTHAFIANYGEGSLTVIKLPDSRNSGSVVQQIRFDGNGPNFERQESSHIHATILSNDGCHLYCSDLGADRIYRFLYNPHSELPLQVVQPIFIDLPAGSGPRHFASSVNGRWLYLITELSGEIFVFDTYKPTEKWVHILKLTENGYQGEPEAADIQVHPNGKTLYVSLRGEINKILVFTVDSLDGNLSLLQRIAAYGQSPRCLLVCEQLGLLLAANEKGNSVSMFNILADGTLELVGKKINLPSPTCLKMFQL
jgi:6-phosphogluconolactonase